MTDLAQHIWLKSEHPPQDSKQTNTEVRPRYDQISKSIYCGTALRVSPLESDRGYRMDGWEALPVYSVQHNVETGRQLMLKSSAFRASSVAQLCDYEPGSKFKLVTMSSR